MATKVLCHKLRVARNLKVTAIYFVYNKRTAQEGLGEDVASIQPII